MPYEDAKTYRFNPFDLTKVWPHSDYPLIKVGTMTLNRNPENFFAQIEQAAFEPSALVPGIGFSPDKMLLGRVFAYSDTHRYRIGPNYLQLPVNRPARRASTPTRRTAPMAYEHRGDDPVYAPNSFGRGYADEVGEVEEGWETDGAMVRQAYTLREDDDDFGQAGTLVREVWNDEIARRSSRPSPVTCSAASRATCSSGPSSTGRTSTPTPASRSRSWSAPGADARRARRPAGRGAKTDAGTPIVEDATQAGTLTQAPAGGRCPARVSERSRHVTDQQGVTDVLGAPYTAATLPLRPDDEGEVVATLVRRPAARRRPTGRCCTCTASPTTSSRPRTADWWVERGYDFYALDLRKYGRSLRCPTRRRTTSPTSPTTTRSSTPPWHGRRRPGTTTSC